MTIFKRFRENRIVKQCAVAKQLFVNLSLFFPSFSVFLFSFLAQIVILSDFHQVRRTGCFVVVASDCLFSKTRKHKQRNHKPYQVYSYFSALHQETVFRAVRLSGDVCAYFQCNFYYYEVPVCWGR